MKSAGQELLHSLFATGSVENGYYNKHISTKSEELDTYWNWAGGGYSNHADDIVLLMSQVICEEPVGEE